MSAHLLHNGRIHTLDAQSPHASALAIIEDKVTAVGTRAECEAALPVQHTKTDLQGRYVYPGFTDAHIHLLNYGYALQKVNLDGLNKQACLDAVSKRAAQSKPGDWVLGHGWNQNDWDGHFPTADELQQVAPDNPVYLSAKSLHAAWVNRAALAVSELTAATADPVDGELVRDATGTPSGILLEGAMQLVVSKLPKHTPTDDQQALLMAQAQLHRFGITAVHDFDYRDCFMALQQLRANDRLQLHVTKSVYVEMMEYAIGMGLQTGCGDDWLRIGAVKAFADGALGPHTAAMIEPYEDDPHNRGILLLDREAIFEIGQQATRNGLSLAIHAIGDRANHELLSAYRMLREYESANNLPQRMHRAEHVQILHTDDQHLLAELNIVASMQPIHALSDMRMADAYWGNRSALSYAWQLQSRQGVMLVFGSDAPVDSPNPFWGLHAAINRTPLGNTAAPAWYPEQRLSRQEAIHAYTHGPAKLAGMSGKTGILRPGAFADLFTLEQDLFSCPAQELQTCLPLSTMAGGKWVFGV